MRKWGFYNRFAWPTEKKCLSNLYTLVPSLSINLTSSCDRKNLHTVKKHFCVLNTLSSQFLTYDI